ncbi:MAG: glycosyltransferase [Candidatus Sericytochromatia bacterium]|nr:glycosyltransferase [Candidatus Sericytochromatia bacterium]
MTSISKIEKIISQNNHRLALNILKSKIEQEPNNDLYYFILAKSYLYFKEYQQAFINFEKAVNINPYGFYNTNGQKQIYSLSLNQLSISGLVKTNRKKVIIETYDDLAVHPIGIYPLADCMTLNNINPDIKPDYYIIPNWLSPSHPILNTLDKFDYPVVSMIVDRLTYAEEHIKANLIYSDIIVCMENYAIDIYKNLGFKNVIYIPGAASIGFDPLSYPKLNLEKIYDVLFIGNINSPWVYKQRNKILKKLDSLKNKYNILITNVDDFNSYWTLMNQSKIIIDATIDSNALNYRMFQTMGIEALCFVEDDNTMVTELYKDKEDLVLYNIDNLDYLINYYLQNKEEYNRIAKNGYLKTINNYTHYHFLKHLMDKLALIDDFSSQKKNFNQKKISMYKGVTSHYQNKHLQAIEFFSQLPEDHQALNNIFVEKICLFEKNNSEDLKHEITSIFTKNKDSFIISFNYICYLFYIQHNYDYCLDLINTILNTAQTGINTLGLYYIPQIEQNIYEYFKYRHGEIIFSYGIESNNYQKEYYKLMIEHLYRLKALIHLKYKDYDNSIINFKECLNLGSENVWDYFEVSHIYRKVGNIKQYRKYLTYCKSILPFEPKFNDF